MTNLELKKARKALKMTQAQMAMWLGKHWNTINKWEMGVNPVDPLAARLIHDLVRQQAHLKRKILMTRKVGMGHSCVAAPKSS
jgi:DNA-binding transcriptional regulator YiaG